MSHQGERHQALAISDLADLPGILPGHAHRLRAGFGQAGVVNDRHGVLAAHKTLGLPSDQCFERLRVPGTVSDESLEMIALSGYDRLGHRGHAFARRRAAEPLHVEWSQAALGGMAKLRQERRKEVWEKPMKPFRKPHKTHPAPCDPGCSMVARIFPKVQLVV